MAKTKEQKELEDAKEEIKQLREALQNAEDDALRIKLGKINQAAGFPSNTAGS